MQYRYEATSIVGFIQTIAVAYVARGYFFYVTGEIPEGKDLAKVDAKLMERYRVGISKFTRARKKRAGQANLQYLQIGLACPDRQSTRLNSSHTVISYAVFC